MRVIALDLVPLLVAKPGIVKPRMWVRGRPRRSHALAATMSAWVESRPPETPMTILGALRSRGLPAEPPAMARSRCSRPLTWML